MMNNRSRPDLETDPPFLDADPPHWAARGLSTLIIALFSVAAIAAVIVTVPETVSGAFVLVPENGADPLRTPREGTVAEVRVAEGQTIAKGATLFVKMTGPEAKVRAEHDRFVAFCASLEVVR